MEAHLPPSKHTMKVVPVPQVGPPEPGAAAVPRQHLAPPPLQLGLAAQRLRLHPGGAPRPVMSPADAHPAAWGVPAASAGCLPNSDPAVTHVPTPTARKTHTDTPMSPPTQARPHCPHPRGPSPPHPTHRLQQRQQQLVRPRVVRQRALQDGHLLLCGRTFAAALVGPQPQHVVLQWRQGRNTLCPVAASYRVTTVVLQG